MEMDDNARQVLTVAARLAQRQTCRRVYVAVHRHVSHTVQLNALCATDI